MPATPHFVNTKLEPKIAVADIRLHRSLGPPRTPRCRPSPPRRPTTLLPGHSQNVLAPIPCVPRASGGGPGPFRGKRKPAAKPGDTESPSDHSAESRAESESWEKTYAGCWATPGGGTPYGGPHARRFAQRASAARRAASRFASGDARAHLAAAACRARLDLRVFAIRRRFRPPLRPAAVRHPFATPLQYYAQSCVPSIDSAYP